ncbi:MAG: hypothetical protein AB1458_14550 [Bacteroidota bacterium]
MKTINWKLITGLSLIGLVIALATTYGLITMRAEQIVWIVVLMFNAFVVAKICSGKYFLHDLLVSLANCVWITGIHFILMDTYISHNPDYLEMLHQLPMPERPRLMALMMGPLIGLVFGIVQGLIALGFSKVLKK